MGVCMFVCVKDVSDALLLVGRLYLSAILKPTAAVVIIKCYIIITRPNHEFYLSLYHMTLTRYSKSSNHLDITWVLFGQIKNT